MRRINVNCFYAESGTKCKINRLEFVFAVWWDLPKWPLCVPTSFLKKAYYLLENCYFGYSNLVNVRNNQPT